MMDFWNDKELMAIIRAYQQELKNAPAESFNHFSILTTHNNKELFHSDVIAAFLDPHMGHNQGDLFLKAFIHFLNAEFKNININPSDYAKAIVKKEFPTKNNDKDGRIDILVYTPTRCIIIENKLNNAVDQEKQLQRYYDFMTEEKQLIVDAIVYLPLDRYKKPCAEELDNTKAKELLCIVPAYIPGNPKCLVNGWILPCAELTTDTNCATILNQYADLIKILNRNNMNTQNTTDLFDNLRISDERWKSAVDLKNMIDSLPELMASRLSENESLVTKSQESDSIFRIWKERNDNFVGFLAHNDKYHIDVWTSLNGYDVYVFEKDNKKAVINIPSLKDIEPTEYGYKITFLPIAEEKVIAYVLNLLDEFTLLK